MIVCWQQVPVASAQGPSPRQQQPDSAICGVVFVLVDVIANHAEHEAVNNVVVHHFVLRASSHVPDVLIHI